MLELLPFLDANCKNMVKSAPESCEALFYRAAFLNFRKLIELVGEIKYAFGLHSST